MPANGRADYVIVGAGSAGCVLAARLSEDPAVRVVVLEAGGSDRQLSIRMPASYGKAFKTPADWNYATVPEPHAAGRSLYIPRGKLLGGSSSINAMLYIRGRPADYDGWRDNGCPGWGWSDVLPYFKRAQHQERGPSALHGTGGPLTVSDQRCTNPLSRTFIEAAVAAGVPANEDFNGPEQMGVGFYQVTQRGGRRWSAANAYLYPAMRRRNVEVRSQALATRVRFEGDRAVAVEYARAGQREELRAEREVILCGGAINSPQLLMLSGVGPADRLRQHGIDVIADLPGVGENLQDHPVVPLTVQVNQPISLLAANKLRYLLQYLLFGRGPLTSCLAEVGAFVSTGSGLPGPDIQFHVAPVLYEEHGLKPVHEHGISIGPTLVSPTSRGHVRLRSADPAAPPEIVTNCLSSPAEVQALVEGLELARQILAAPPLRQLVTAERTPGPAAKTREQLADYVRQAVELLYHPVGTCRMGSDDAAVVTPELAVRGLQGLRVVDASIMPAVPAGNTNAPTIMVAEKAADLIRRPAQLSRD